MSQVGTDEERKAGPDLSLLAEMVGIRRGLAVMADKHLPPTSEMVLALMETEKAVYATASTFALKEQALGRIIEAFQEGRLNVDDVLKAAGLDTIQVEPKVGFFKRLLGR